MAAKRTDPEIEDRICTLRTDGLKVDEIVERTGVPKGTVKDILKRRGITGKKPSANPSAESSGESTHTRTHEVSGIEPSHPSNPSADGADEINPNLNQRETANEIIQYTQFFRSRTKRIPYDLNQRDMAWAEGNYGKRWADGIKMMVDATGLSPEAIMAAVDDYEIDVASALERFNSKFRDERSC